MGRTFLLAALLVVAACGEAPTRPTTVPGPADPPKPPPPTSTGEITVGEISPGSGATIVLHLCRPDIVSLCSDQFHATFDVLVPVDIAKAVVVMSLRQNSLPCAAAFIFTTLKAGNRASFSTSSISMDPDEGGRLICATPAETTTLMVSVFYEGAPAQAVVSREVPYRYTLTAQ